MVNTPYIERDCIFTHEGKAFESAGAIVTPDIVVGYVGKVIGGRGFNGALGSEHPYRALTDWHGNSLGTIRLTSSWRTPRSYMASRMYQAYATVNGVTYTGRTCGEGMIFTGKRCAKQYPVKA